MRSGWLGVLTTGVALGVLGAAEVAAAQSPIPFSVEARAAAAFPRGALDENWGTGVGFGVTATVQLLPNYGIYGGYSRTTFGADDNGLANAVDSGFAVGLTRAFVVAGPALVPWVGTGLLIHDMEVAGVANAGGDSQLGFEFGGGVAAALTPRVRLTPGIGYRQYGVRLLGAERETVSYFSIGIGLNVAF
jgi:hypothetical protein